MMDKLQKMIADGEITIDRVNELMSMTDEELLESLEDGYTIMGDYYFNQFFIEKYEGDESFMKAGTGISRENRAIELILKERGVEKPQ